MHNLTTVIRFEFIRTVTKRSFWLSVLAFPLIFAVISAVVWFSNTASERSEQANQTERFSVVVFDASGLVTDEAIEGVGGTRVATQDAGSAAVLSGRTDAFFAYPADPATTPVRVQARDVGLIKNSRYDTAAAAVLRQSAAAAIDAPVALAVIRDGVRTDVTTYRDGVAQDGFEQVIAPGVFLVLLYAVIVLLANQMLTSTTEEKENRVIEMMLTTLQARTLIVGKIIALALVGLVQVAALSIPTLLTAVLAGNRLPFAVDIDTIPLDPGRIAIGAAVFLASFLLFTGILVGIGAIVPTAKEAGSFFGAVIGLMFVPLYAVSAVVTSPDDIVVRVFTYVPFTAPVTLLLRNAVGNLGLGEAIGGTGIILACGLVAISLAVRAFQYGTLQYDRRLGWREIWPF